MRPTFAAFAAAMVLAADFAAAANSELGEHFVIRESNLREQPSPSAARVALIAPGTDLEVLEKPIKNGYAHVRTADGQEGWLLHRNLLLGLLLEAQDNDETGPPGGLGAAKGCGDKFADAFTSLTECPTTGCAAEDEAGNGLSNKIKRRKINMSGNATFLTFDDIHELQAETEHANYPVLVFPEPAERNALKTVRIRNGTLGLREGKFVAVAGFIASDRPITCGSQESVNCTFTDPRVKDGEAACKNTDIHIALTEDRNQEEKSGMVVEPIPFRSLNEKLTPKLLAEFRDDERKVLVMGQLFYDSFHAPDPKGKTGQPDRFTVWEVHPVERFFVCPTNQDCDAEDLSQWEEIKSQ